MLLVEERTRIVGVSWSSYVTLRDELDAEGSHVHLTYLDGALEIMRPGAQQQRAKKLLTRLIEAYAEECDLDLDGWGSPTYCNQALDCALEPDECFSLGGAGRAPDLAIEIVFSRCCVDKLRIYDRLEVGEVWVLTDSGLTINVRAADGYVVTTRSALFGDLDPGLLSRFVRLDQSQTRLVKAWRLLCEPHV